MGDDDEEVERQRQQREDAKLSPMDRLYQRLEPTLAGDEDQRKNRRRGRVIRMPLGMQVRVRAMLVLILKRDNHEGLPTLFEIMMDAYLEKYGGLDETAIASEAELIQRHLEQRAKKDAK